MKNKIILHCSDSDFGDAATIDRWHRERGWDGIGYHYVILNGQIASDVFLDSKVGAVEEGRPVSQDGAHCRGYNKTSIGICMIGKGQIKHRVIQSALDLCMDLSSHYSIDVEDVIGHYETTSGKKQGKTCPDIDMRSFRAALRLRLPIREYVTTIDGKCSISVRVKAVSQKNAEQETRRALMAGLPALSTGDGRVDVELYGFTTIGSTHEEKE